MNTPDIWIHVCIKALRRFLGINYISGKPNHICRKGCWCPSTKSLLYTTKLHQHGKSSRAALRVGNRLLAGHAVNCICKNPLPLLWRTEPSSGTPYCTDPAEGARVGRAVTLPAVGLRVGGGAEHARAMMRPLMQLRLRRLRSSTSSAAARMVAPARHGRKC